MTIVRCIKCKKVCEDPNINALAEPSAACDVCKRWVHFKCGDLTEEIKDFPFSCTECDPERKSLEQYNAHMEEVAKNIKEANNANEILIAQLIETHQSHLKESEQIINSIKNEKDENRSSEFYAQFSDDLITRLLNFEQNYFKLKQLIKKDEDKGIATIYKYTLDNFEDIKTMTSWGLKNNFAKIPDNVKFIEREIKTPEENEALKLELEKLKQDREEFEKYVKEKLEQPSPEISQQNNNKGSPRDDDLKEWIKIMVERQNKGINLSKLNLPTFTSTPDTWRSFKDVASILVADPGINDLRKLIALKDACVGEAKQLIKNVASCPGAYMTAFNILLERYDDPRKLLKAEFTNLLAHSTEKLNGLKNIKSLLNKTTNINANIRGILIEQQQSLALKTGKPVKLLTDEQLKARLFDSLFIHCISSQLDFHASINYEEFLAQNKLEHSTVENLQQFLDAYAKKLEQTERYKIYSNENKNAQPEKIQLHKRVNTLKVIPCKMCERSGHEIKFCREFLALNPVQRLNLLKKKLICINCMGHNYDAKNKCRQPNNCIKCKGFHNTLLHRSKDKSPNTTFKHTKRVHMTYLKDQIKNPMEQITLIPTAVAPISNLHNGKSIKTRILIDSGSELSLVDDYIVKELKLKIMPSENQVYGLGGTEVSKTSGFVQFYIKSRQGTLIKVTAAVVPKVVQASADKFNNSSLKIPKIKGAADTKRNAEIRILLGSDNIPSIMNNKNNSLFTQKSLLGTLISGNCNQEVTNENQQINSCIILKDSEQMLNKIPEIPSQLIGIKKDFIDSQELLHRKSVNKDFISEMENELEEQKNESTLEEVICEKNFMTHIKVLNDGRIRTALPLFEAEKMRTMGETRGVAFSRFLAQEKRLARNPEILKAYNESIINMISKGIVEEVKNENTNLNPAYPVCYLTHLAVIKNERKTTKVRVVFNCSMKTLVNNKLIGPSFNELQFKGPKLQKFLPSILIGFIKSKYILIADLSQMYNSIEIIEKQRDLMRFFFRPNQHGPVKVYRHTRLNFGTRAAPYIANRTLQFVCEKNEIATQLLDKIYIDDLISSFDSENEAIEKITILNEVLQAHQFHLHKISSNSDFIIKSLKNLELSDIDHLFEDSEQISTLGLKWNRKEDYFYFRIKPFEKITKITKRVIISQLATVFDPLGLLTFIDLFIKRFIQKVCITYDWDQVVSPEIEAEFNNLKQEILKIESLKISRWSHFTPTAKFMLIGFADGSFLGASCLIYLRTVDQGKVNFKLICGKSKIAPATPRVLSIPKIELISLLLLANLMHMTAKAMNFEINQETVACFSDSTCALAWITQTDLIASRKIFVAHRVNKIRSLVPSHLFYHVDGSKNLADCSSRIMTVDDLIKAPFCYENHPEYIKEPLILKTSAFYTHEETKLKEKMGDGKSILVSTKQPENNNDSYDDITQ